MFKDTIISILTGITISQHFNPLDTPARLAIILIVAVTAAIGRYIHTVRRRIYSRVIWHMIQLHAWPRERVLL